MPVALGRAHLEAILRAVVDELDGDFVVVGGAAAALWLTPRRITNDIDIFPVAGRGHNQLELMRLAVRLGLGVEAVNSAADFFVQRIPGWSEDLEVMLAGRRGRILRLSATVFLLSKLERLSETDAADCRAVLALAQAGKARVDGGRVLAALEALPRTEDQRLRRRRQALRRALVKATG